MVSQGLPSAQKQSGQSIAHTALFAPNQQTPKLLTDFWIIVFSCPDTFRTRTGIHIMHLHSSTPDALPVPLAEPLPCLQQRKHICGTPACTVDGGSWVNAGSCRTGAGSRHRLASAQPMQTHLASLANLGQSPSHQVKYSKLLPLHRQINKNLAADWKVTAWQSFLPWKCRNVVCECAFLSA